MPGIFSAIFNKLIAACLLVGLFALTSLIPLTATAASNSIELTSAEIESTAAGYRLSAAYNFELNRGLEDTINRGVPLYFTIDVELTRPRWYWFDKQAAKSSETIRISYNVLTRQYQASVNNGLQQTFDTLEDALLLIRRPNRWIIASHDQIQPGETYAVGIRMGLDTAQLAKPLQVNALNNSDWHFSSDWKFFSYTVP